MSEAKGLSAINSQQMTTRGTLMQVVTMMSGPANGVRDARELLTDAGNVTTLQSTYEYTLQGCVGGDRNASRPTRWNGARSNGFANAS